MCSPGLDFQAAVAHRILSVSTARRIHTRPLSRHEQGMRIEDVTVSLGYAGNPSFLTGEALGQARDYAHIFRRASERMNLHGVYALY